MKSVVGLVVAVLILCVAGVASADHVGTGVILVAGPGEGTMTLVLKEGRPWTLVLGEATKVYDDSGREISPSRLGPGDYVREVCVKLPDWRILAKQITVLRPAWRELGTPEL